MKEKKKHKMSERERKQEEFKERLIEEVIVKDAERIQMEKVTMLIWQFRDDPDLIQTMTRYLTEFSGVRDVFDGVEFYLPQLAHMIIHLEASWDDATLQRFALVIAQHSLHVALQLNWILQGAIEDYQPETPDGSANSAYNPLFYKRCVKLLDTLERCVIYTTPRAEKFLKMFETGEITQVELEELEIADRNFNATQIMEPNNENGIHDFDEDSSDLNFFGGYLLYKRRVRKSPYRRKLWKQRYFTVESRTLHCYHTKGGQLVRAMPLDGATVNFLDGKYPHMFEIKNQNYVYQVRASSQEVKDKWIQTIQQKSDCLSFMENSLSYQHGDDSTIPGQQLTPAQKARYEFYSEERNFIWQLCNIAEQLRFVPRDERKQNAPLLMQKLQIPSLVYLPLCNSTDTWRRVDKAIYNEIRVFNTNERCPTLMYFFSKRGEGKRQDIDVATFLFEHLDNFEEEQEEKLMLDIQTNDGNFEVDIQDKLIEFNDTPSLEEPNLSEKENSESASLGLWHEENTSNNTKSRNLNLMREQMAKAFPKLFKSMEKRASRKMSKLKKTALVQSVKIVETPNTPDEDYANTPQEDYEIDEESLNRAKDTVCGGETWAGKRERMLAQNDEHSVHSGDIVNVESVIAKSNDDLRQEVFVMQMIHYYKSVFVKEGLPIWLFTYRILSTSKTTGLIEVINNAISIDGLKKSENFPSKGGLRQYFINTYGDNTPSFKAAQRNFMLSLVGYSLVSFLLGLKDRHNGNIMIDTRGYLIFIDFGFAMGMAPGHEFSFERAAFKLTMDYMDVMGGSKSECFAEFKRLFIAGFEAARANAQVALGLVEIMMYKSNFPCFTGSRYGGGISLKRFEDRLMLDVPDSKIKKKALTLIENAINHTGTVLYDKFQYHSNGYIP